MKKTCIWWMNTLSEMMMDNKWTAVLQCECSNVTCNKNNISNVWPHGGSLQAVPTVMQMQIFVFIFCTHEVPPQCDVSGRQTYTDRQSDCNTVTVTLTSWTLRICVQTWDPAVWLGINKHTRPGVCTTLPPTPYPWVCVCVEGSRSAMQARLGGFQSLM